MQIKREGKEFQVVEKVRGNMVADDYVLFKSLDFESCRRFLAVHGNKDAGFELVEHGNETYIRKRKK